MASTYEIWKALAKSEVIEVIDVRQSPFSLLFFAVILVTGSCASARAESVRVVSDDLHEINSFIFPQRAVNNQSGERLVIDAVMMDASDADTLSNEDTALLKRNFSFGIPEGKIGERLCVDLASKHAGFRKVSLLELINPVDQVSARIDIPETATFGQDGMVMVAYPTKDKSEDPVKACLLQEDWIYPAQLSASGQLGDDRVLQLRINTGGSAASVIQLTATNAGIGRSQSCDRDDRGNGLFNRVCRLKLLRTAQGFTRIRLTVRQTNASPIQKDFYVGSAARKP
ncbi:hypothetical protein C8J35_1213 [Rhizobium sp. PP-F2F-G38]|nr:hypothetical protein C8J35_1213 [Rhizobium sp. PP-F2F-G38]